MSKNDQKIVFNPKMGGFTLIELLVVVLIIGILAAVAVPQYQVAVAKTRLASHFPLMRSLQKAQGAYYLANGEYATQIEDLDVDVECHQNGTNAQAGECYLDKDGKVWVRWVGYYFMLGDSRAGRAFLLFFNFPDSYSASCYAYDDFAKRVCQSLTGKEAKMNGNITTYSIF